MTIRRHSAEIIWRDHFPTTLAQDLAHTFLGNVLGSGVAREVYECAHDPQFVVKMENVAQSFQNVAEWYVWFDIKDTKWKKWFAPCQRISPCGTVLIQEKTEPIDVLPKKVPSFFTDLKRDNWGLLDGQPVCHDYGTMKLINIIVPKMIKATWRDE